MKMKLTAYLVILILLISLMAVVDLHFEITYEVKGATITVDDNGPADYSTIQEAIDAAKPGDTIYVFSGTYFEHVIIDKLLSLQGEGKNTTIIHGGGSGDVVTIIADDVFFSGFNITGSGKKNNHFGLDRDHGDAGIQVNSNNNTIIDNILYSNHLAIYLNHSSYNDINNNFVSNNSNSIFSYFANNNTIIQNSGYMNKDGIHLHLSRGNEIYNNNILRTKYLGNGVHLVRSPENKIMGNVVKGSWQGIYIEESDLNDIVGNDITNTKYGIRFRNILHNNVIGNTISNSLNYGLYIFDSYYNIFHHNNINNNSKQVFDNTNSGNMWNNGFPSEGNFWSDYNGIDNDGNGIGDTPYSIDPDSFDCYPLMNKYLFPSNTNINPWADAGQDQVVYLNDIAQFNGSASIDPFGYIASYEWNFSDGSQNNTGAYPTHTYHNTGIFTVTLTVQDKDGNINMDTCIVEVCTVFPKPEAGPDQFVKIGDVVQFNGSESRDPDADWMIETVDIQSRVNGFTSLALDSMGNPHLAYAHHDSPTYSELKYANNSGGNWFIDTIETGTSLSSHLSIAVDENFIPHISFYEGMNDDLKYARLNGTAWDIEMVDPVKAVGQTPHIVLDSNNRPHISYHDYSNMKLKYAWYDGSKWFNTTVDSAYQPMPIVLDSTDTPHISYFDVNNYDLKYAVKTGATWSINTVDQQGDVGRGSSLTLDADENPHISYVDLTNRKLKYARFDGSTWQIDSIDIHSHSIGGTSLAIDSMGNPHIFFSDLVNTDVLYAIKIGNEWIVETVDEVMSTNGASLALNGDDIPHVVYPETFYGDVRFAWKRGGITSYYWDFGDGSNSTEMKPSHVYNIPGVYTVTLTVTDNQGNTDSDYCIITVRPYLYLQPGWNLISLPVILVDTNIQKVFQSITGDYDAVQVYNRLDNQDPWKHYHILKPDHFNDLKEIDYKSGIFVHVTNPNGTTLILNGSKPLLNQHITLHKGWNLVGYPSHLNSNRTVGLNNLEFGIDLTCIQWFNATTKTWHFMEENDSFEIGRGYWMHSTKNTTWEVPL